MRRFIDAVELGRGRSEDRSPDFAEDLAIDHEEVTQSVENVIQEKGQNKKNYISAPISANFVAFRISMFIFHVFRVRNWRWIRIPVIHVKYMLGI